MNAPPRRHLRHEKITSSWVVSQYQKFHILILSSCVSKYAVELQNTHGTKLRLWKKWILWLGPSSSLTECDVYFVQKKRDNAQRGGWVWNNMYIWKGAVKQSFWSGGAFNIGGLEILLGGNTGFIKVKGNTFWGLDCKLTLHIDFNTAFLNSSLFTHLGVGGRL